MRRFHSDTGEVADHFQIENVFGLLGFGEDEKDEIERCAISLDEAMDFRYRKSLRDEVHADEVDTDLFGNTPNNDTEDFLLLESIGVKAYTRLAKTTR